VKRIVRIFIVEGLVLFAVSQITMGLYFRNGTPSLLMTAGALTLASLFVKPIINLFLLPLNLLTFGFFRFLTNAITLYLVDLVLKDFAVGNFLFKGYSGHLIVIPSIGLPAGPLSYLGFSFLLSFVSGIIYWLIV
jgi:putative membrane protein